MYYTYMKLYYIRHAQSENNVLESNEDYHILRSADPGLTKLGRKQAERLGAFLMGGEYTHLYSSLMIRAVATGEVIAEHIDIPLHGWEEIHECGGVVNFNPETQEFEGTAGMNRTYYQDHFPDLLLPEHIDHIGWWNNRPFEEEDERYARARHVVDIIKERHSGTDDIVIMVSHGHFFVYFLYALLDQPYRRERWFNLRNTGISRFDFLEDGRIMVRYINRVEFLPKELISG